MQSGQQWTVEFLDNCQACSSAVNCKSWISAGNCCGFSATAMFARTPLHTSHSITTRILTIVALLFLAATLLALIFLGRLSLQSLLVSVGFSVDENRFRMMDEAVDQGDDTGGIREDVFPVVED